MSDTPESGLPKGISGEEETPIPERVVRWDLTPEDIAQMRGAEVRELAIDHQLMIGRLQEAIEVVRRAAETNSKITKADLDVIYSPEKREEHDHLRQREME